MGEHPVRSQAPLREFFECIRDEAARIDGRNCMTLASIIKRWAEEGIAVLDEASVLEGGLRSDRFRVVNDPVVVELEAGES